jgi:hypothetical protein
MGIISDMLKRYSAFLLVILLAGCSATKKSTAPVAPVASAPSPVDTIVVAPAPVKVQEPEFRDVTFGLLLPLQLDDHFALDTIPDDEPLILPSSIPALNFYEGAITASTDFVSKVSKIKLHVIDIGGDSLTTVTALNAKIKDTCDFYLSMVPGNCNQSLVSFAKRCNRPVFILSGSNTAILEGNPNIWLSMPSNLTSLKEYSSFLYSAYFNSNFMLVYRDVRKENDLAAFIGSIIDSTSQKPNTCAKVNYKSAGWAGISAKLSKTKKNVLIIPTNDESYLSTLVRKIDEVSADYEIMICGLPTWDGFETVDQALLKKLNTHIFNGIYLDYTNVNVLNFRQKFITNYHNDPMAPAFQAFDLITHLTSNYEKFGYDFDKYIAKPTIEAPVGGFRFERVGANGGWENRNLSILKYADYKYIRINK